MECNNSQFKIEITSEDTLVSTGNELIYFFDTEYKPSSIVKIFVSDGNNTSHCAMIAASGGGTTVHSTSFVANETELVVCCSDTVFSLSIPDLKLKWHTKADEATCFEIFKIQNGFIVHGELSISRLDENGNIIWQNQGADIFTTIEGTDNFTVADGYIIATDFGYRKYKFNFAGVDISDTIEI
ncbi:MAG: hypothetical protein L6Q81_08090 [Bacteroidia bacterium]|nr:hypothetical protein [Bacteroidia bacterium]